MFFDRHQSTKPFHSCSEAINRSPSELPGNADPSENRNGCKKILATFIREVSMYFRFVHTTLVVDEAAHSWLGMICAPRSRGRAADDSGGSRGAGGGGGTGGGVGVGAGLGGTAAGAGASPPPPQAVVAAAPSASDARKNARREVLFIPRFPVPQLTDVRHQSKTVRIGKHHQIW